MVTKRKWEPDSDSMEIRWDSFKSLLCEQYWNLGLPKLIILMAEEHGFIASKNQYERKFKEWKLRKNLKQDEWLYALYKKHKRDVSGKSSLVKLNDVVIPEDKILKQESRYSISELAMIYAGGENAQSPAAPQDISVCTPPSFTEENTYSIKSMVSVVNLPSFSVLKAFYEMSIPSSFSQSTPSESLRKEIFAPSLSKLFELFDASKEMITIRCQARRLTTFANHTSMIDLSMPCLGRLFGTSITAKVLERAALLLHVYSNNLCDYICEEETEVLEWITSQGHSFLRALFVWQSRSVQACLEGLLTRQARARLCFTTLHILIEADKERLLFKGRRVILLFIATKISSAQVVRQLLAELNGINLNACIPLRFSADRYINDNNSGTLLEAAVTTEIVSMLLSAGAKADSPAGSSCLHKALGAHDTTLANLLTNAGARTREDRKIRVVPRFNSKPRKKAELEKLERLITSECDPCYLLDACHEFSFLGTKKKCFSMFMKISADHSTRGPCFQWSPLETALSIWDSPAARRLILDGADLITPPRHYASFLHLVVKYGRRNQVECAEMITLMLGNGLPYSEAGIIQGGEDEDEKDLTALQIVLDWHDDFSPADRKVKLIRVLLSAGEKVNFPKLTRIQRPFYRYPELSFEIVNALLEHGTKADSMLYQHVTLLQAAIGFGYEHQSLKTAMLLLDHGANVNAAAGGPYGLTPLQAAISHGNLNLQLIQLLLAEGAEVNAHPAIFDGRTALQAAILHKKPDLQLIQLLLDAGADVNAQPAIFWGRTALQAATSHDEPDLRLIQLLLDQGAEVNALPAEQGGVTALQGAAIAGHLKIVHMLLELGADLNAPGSAIKGRTALEGAAERGRLDIVYLLLENGARSTGRVVKFAEANAHFFIANILTRKLRVLIGPQLAQQELDAADISRD